MAAIGNRQLEHAQTMSNRLFDLPGYVLDRLAASVIAVGWSPHEDSSHRRRLGWDNASPSCRRGGGHGRCAWVDCVCGCHAGQEYVPVRGWLPDAEAQEERRAYLDEDAAIERAYGEAGGV